jgi:6-phosphogluconolactonase
VHPSGRFLYISNRGPDTIGVFSVDPAKGTLALIQQESTRGISPRHFALDPTGSNLLAANNYTDRVVVFRVDSQTGRLVRLDKSFQVFAPVCVRFVAVK